MSLRGKPSNNPAGRTPGRGLAGQLRHELLPADKLKAVVEKLHQQALAGDVSAANALLDRAIPRLRPQAQRQAFTLPANGTPTQQAQALLAAAAAGELPADVASELIAAIGRVVGIAEADELRRRLDELEFGGVA